MKSVPRMCHSPKTQMQEENPLFVLHALALAFSLPKVVDSDESRVPCLAVCAVWWQVESTPSIALW